MRYWEGRTFPLGSHICQQNQCEGVNFAIFSQHATACELAIFTEQGEIRLPMFRTEHIWHLFVADIGAGTRYGFRVHGKTIENKGFLFNPNKLLLDPYAKLIEGKADLSNEEKCRWFHWADERDNAHLAPKSVVTQSSHFDWKDDTPPLISWEKTIIYETHIRGFSQLNPFIPVEIAGTYAGMAHDNSISHLKKLGITAVELLPVTYSLDERHLQKQKLRNYWGYNVLGHFAIETEYAANKSDPISEFKHLVKKLHQNNIEIIMDVVFNHTAEGDKNDPMFCQRGIDNATYYWLNEKGENHNWSGCGNSLNLSSIPLVQWVIDCLSYWVEEFHIDGFRFDLAPILGRTPSFEQKSLFFTAIRTHSRLAHIKLIAEPWDIGNNGYQLGKFPFSFFEWNDRFRDDVRNFFLHESGNIATLAHRLAGSDDYFSCYPSTRSINFLTAHDGFNLTDLVSYCCKHNATNGENNQDGHNHNYSINYGCEGPSHNDAIIVARKNAKRALLAVLFLANGVPMLLSGDELGHSQQGNNNCYCQDNEITWLNWQNVDDALIDYVANLIKLRQKIPLLSQLKWWKSSEVQWFKPNGQLMQQSDWHDNSIKSLQILLQNKWLILINGKHCEQEFLLSKGQWQYLLGKENMALLRDTLVVTLSSIGVCVLQRIEIY